MKPLAVVLLASALAFMGVAVAEPITGSPLLGSWAVDISRLPMPPQARPRSVTITFSGERDGRLGTRVEVVDPNGERLHAEGVTPLDGVPTPVTSSFEADVSATTMPAPEVLVMQLAKDGVPASTRIYTVAADGKSMTETVAYFGQDGQPVLRKNFFSRIQQPAATFAR
jgi:hypothetical protein